MAKTILLADDSVTIQKVVALTFMDQDYEVVPVSDGAAALAKLGEVQPDLVISDVHMPGQNGYEVCRRVKEARPGTPVMLLVGTFEQFDEAAAADAGADGHLKKPFDSQELQKRVEELTSGSGAAKKSVEEAPAEKATVEMPTMPTMPPASGATAGDLEPTDAAAGSSPSPSEPFGSSPSADPFGSEPFASPSSTSEPTPAPFAPPPEPRPREARAAASPSAEPASKSPSSAEPSKPSPSEPSSETSSEKPSSAGPSAANGSGMSDDDVERVARRVVELMGEKAVREVAWEVIPDLAEVIIKERLRELESQVE